MWNILEAAIKRVAVVWLMSSNSLVCANMCLQLADLICAALKSALVVGIRERTAQPSVLKIGANAYAGLVQHQAHCSVRLVHQLSDQIQWVFSKYGQEKSFLYCYV